MSEAPRKIWAVDGVAEVLSFNVYDNGGTEYIRADIAQAEKEAAVAAERAACAEIAFSHEPTKTTSAFEDGQATTALQIADSIRARGNADALAERDARVRAEALRGAGQAWDELRYVAVQNTNNPEERAALIARMDAALIPSSVGEADRPTPFGLSCANYADKEENLND
jgi:hypothetical protein